MTDVGDVNQTGNPAGVTSWRSVFDVLAKDRWSIETLSVNYRTPRPVMELATAGLRAAGIDAAEVVSARAGDACAARIVAVAGEIDSVHVGRLRRVPVDALTSYVARLRANGSARRPTP